MPVALLIIGAMMIASGVKGTQDDLFSLIKSDFTGGPKNNGFLSWALAIGAIAALGYYRPIKPISNALLLLVFVMLFLSNKGIASQFDSQTSNTATNVPPLNSEPFKNALDSLKNAIGKLQ